MKDAIPVTGEPGPKEARDALARAGDDLAAVTRLVTRVEGMVLDARTVRIGLSGNVTLDLLAPFLRKHAVLGDLQATVSLGPIADRVGGVRELAAGGVDAIVILDWFDALMPAFEARSGHLEPDLLLDRVNGYRAELDLALATAASVPRILVGTLHAMGSPATGPDAGSSAAAIAAFNEVLLGAAKAYPNVELIDTSALCARIGWERSHDPRSYRRFAAPFSPTFADALAQEVFLRSRGFDSYFLKALILDCDGTLWGGTIGEDLIGGITLAPQGNPAGIYWEAQHRLLALRRNGVLLGLCSRNNEADVAEVFTRHPHMVLRDEDITIRRINWGAKADNLREIAEALGIGLDSLVFVDDAAIECDAVRTRLPAVRVFQVPADLSTYPRMLDDIADLFQAGGPTIADTDKTAQYRIRELALADRVNFATQEAYLASLGIRVTIRLNDRASAPRIAELTQKSNQFNLTTRRRTEAEILDLMGSGLADVLSVNVQDRFGDSGLTGVAIVTFEGETAKVDSFLLSCRILGRGVEDACWPVVFDDLRARGCRRLGATYLPTAKNGQVREFWERAGFTLVRAHPDGRRDYELDLPESPDATPPPFVEVIRAY